MYKIKRQSVAHRPPEGRRASHRAGGEETDSGGQFRYLGGEVYGDGKTERGMLKSTGRSERVESSVMADRRISKRQKGKVMKTCVTPACLYGTETLALTELQQQRLHVCENNWVRKIACNSNEGRLEKNGGGYGSADDLDKETGEEQTTVDRTRRI